MSAWEHPSKDLFRAGRGAMVPTTADRERVRARLAAKLGAAAVAATITTTSAKAAAATAGSAGTAAATAGAAGASAQAGALVLAAKIALPLLLALGAATIAAPHVMKKTPATPAAAAVANTPVVLETKASPSPSPSPSPPLETATVSVADLPTVTAAPAPVPAHAVQAKASADPVEEARMLAAIDEALRGGDSARALRLADDHAKGFPNGVLVEEREGGRAIARCMNGSRSSADAFLATHPRSPMRGRIVATCGEKP